MVKEFDERKGAYSPEKPPPTPVGGNLGLGEGLPLGMQNIDERDEHRTGIKESLREDLHGWAGFSDIKVTALPMTPKGFEPSKIRPESTWYRLSADLRQDIPPSATLEFIADKCIQRLVQHEPAARAAWAKRSNSIAEWVTGYGQLALALPGAKLAILFTGALEKALLARVHQVGRAT
jgi:hypothetical protein